MRHSLCLLCSVLLALVVGSACSSNLSPPTAQIATLDSTAVVGAHIVLDGTGSHDPNGWALQYRWRLVGVPAGSDASVHAADASVAWFNPDVSGTYSIELVVSDGTLTSAPATATLTAGPCGGNSPTLSNIAFSPVTPTVGDLVVVASNARDADMNPSCSVGDSLDYHWSITSLPPGSAAKLNATDVATPSFIADQPGSYTVRLSVTDRAGHAAAPVERTLSVAGCIAGIPMLSELVANPATPVIGQPVTLKATGFLQNPVPAIPDAGAPGTGGGSGGSMDGGVAGTAGTSAGGSGGMAGAAATGGSAGAGGSGGTPPPTVCADTPLTYHWTLIEVPPQSAVSLVDSPLHQPSFIPDVAGSYVVEVHVTNPDGVSSPSLTLALEVGACGSAAPTISQISASPSAPATGQAVSLSAQIADADTSAPCSLAEQFTYRWSLVATPGGSKAELSAATATPWFTADVPGKYTVALVVVDSEGHASAQKSFDITAGSCGSNAPSVTAVRATPSAPAVGTPVSLSATVSDADTAAPCNLTEQLSLSWSIVSRPSGSQATLSSSTDASPWFLVDVPGTYQVQAVAIDGAGHVSAARSLSLNVSTCGSAAPVIGSLAAAPAAPVVGSGVTVTASVSDADTAAGCGLNEVFSYSWSLTAVPGGSTAVIADRTAPIASFVPDRAGAYTASLVVTDGEGHVSDASTRTVTVAAPSTCGTATPIALLAGVTGGACPGACTAVTITPAPPTAPNPNPPNYSIALDGHASILLDGTASNDPDNAAPCNAKQTLSWTWSIIGAPVGSKASFSIGDATSTLATPTFNVDLSGVYLVRLIVSDGKNSSTPIVVQLTF